MTFTRTKNIRDLIFRAQVPKILRRGGLRNTRPPGFFKCGKRQNCALCLHSQNATSYTCPVTGRTANITQHISCQNAGVYLVLCKKDSGLCARLKPTYVGICGEGESSSFTHRLGGHLGTATQTCQDNTVKPGKDLTFGNLKQRSVWECRILNTALILTQAKCNTSQVVS